MDNDTKATALKDIDNQLNKLVDTAEPVDDNASKTPNPTDEDKIDAQIQIADDKLSFNKNDETEEMELEW